MSTPLTPERHGLIMKEIDKLRKAGIEVGVRRLAKNMSADPILGASDWDQRRAQETADAAETAAVEQLERIALMLSEHVDFGK